MTITRVKLENFTVFESLDLEPSPGINVLVGANGTGKTHLMKVCYAACDVTNNSEPFLQKLTNVFLPSRKNFSRLVRKHREVFDGVITILRGTLELNLTICRNEEDPRLGSAQSSTGIWADTPVPCAYIPAKEILSNAPGFQSLYAQRNIHFEETYRDILQRAYLPSLRKPASMIHDRLMVSLQNAIDGTVTTHGEEFFLSNEQGDFEFTLLAEGQRKLGLLWLLIRNGSLRPGAVLFWDEPETNLNPKLYGVVIDVLLELQRLGVQVFLATHDYVILKELDLQAREGDKVAFHSLYRSEETGEIACRSTDSFHQIHPNVISEVFDSIYDRDVRRALEGVVK